MLFILFLMQGSRITFCTVFVLSTLLKEITETTGKWQEMIINNLIRNEN